MMDRETATWKQCRKGPLVSIVTPSYNQGQFIEETILSVKNQNYPNIEHIIIDGGSTDNTLEILKRYEGTYDIRWISEPDCGQSDAINKGWKMATGEILSWLNSDDTYVPNAVSTVVDCFKCYPEVALVYGDCNVINEKGEIIGRIRAQDCDLHKLVHVRADCIFQPATFIRQRIIKEIGFLDVSLHYSMDYDFYIRIVNKFTVKRFPVVLANYRVHRNTKTRRAGMKMTQEAFLVSNRYGGKPMDLLKIRSYVSWTVRPPLRPLKSIVLRTWRFVNSRFAK